MNSRSSSRVDPSSRVEAPKRVARTGAPGSDTRVRLTVSSSGASGAQACQAETRSSRAMSDQCASMRVVIGSGTVSNRSDVTTPNWPPPAPRRPQNKSGSRSWSQSTTLPSASTTCAPTRRSQVSPCLRPSRPIPPPRVRPVMPTVGPAPGRQGPAVGVQRRVHLSQAGAGSDRGDPVVCHGDAVEAGQVEHDPVRRRSAREAVPPATRGDAVPGGCRVRHGADDVGDRAAQDHEPGTHLPVGEVDRTADRFVARRVGAEHLAVERVAELG